MAQRVRALATLGENTYLVPSSHMMTLNSADTSHTYGAPTYMQAKHTTAPHMK